MRKSPTASLIYLQNANMASVDGEIDRPSGDVIDEDDFDLNAEELPTEDDQTPAVSALDQDDDSADIETDDEELPEGVRVQASQIILVDGTLNLLAFSNCLQFKTRHIKVKIHQPKASKPCRPSNPFKQSGKSRRGRKSAFGYKKSRERPIWKR